MSEVSKSELLKELEEKVAKLHEQTEVTREGLEEAAEWIADDGVLDVKRIDSLRTLLNEVKALSLTTDKLLKSLGFDAMPSSFTEFSEEIDVLKVLLDKSVYIEAKDFLLRLRIHDEKIAELFDRVKEDLMAMDIESMTAEECRSELGSYVTLRKLLDPATDNGVKVSCMSSLVGTFDQRILGLAFGDAYTIEDEPVAASQRTHTEEAGKTASDEPDAAKTESEIVDSAAETENEQDSITVEDDEWDIEPEDIDIPEDIENRLCDVPEITVIMEEAEAQANKPFSIKKFKESLKSRYLSIGCRWFMAHLGHIFAMPMGTVEEPLMVTIGKEEFNLNECQDFLYRKGYIRTFTAPGFPPICGLTKKGAAMMKNKSACEFIGIPYNPHFGAIVSTDTAQDFLSMSFRADAWELVYKAAVSLECTVASNYQLSLLSDGPDDCYDTLVTNVFPKDRDDLYEYIDRLLEMLDGVELDQVNIFGRTDENARALGDLLCLVANDSIGPDTDIYCYTFEAPPEGTEPGTALRVGKTGVEKTEDPTPEDATVDGEDKALKKEYKCPYCNQPLYMISKTNGDIFYGHLDGLKSDAPCTHTFGSLKEILDGKGCNVKADKPNKKAKAVPAEPKANEEKPAVPKAKKSVAEDEALRQIERKTADFINGGSLYCATAYAAAAALENPKAEALKGRLAYAVNDPAAHCIYTSDNLFGIYTDFPSQADYYYQTSAVLRLFFAGQARYDYNLQAIHDSINGSPALEDNKALNDLIYTLREFKTKTGCSADRYADYRSHDRVALEKELARLKAEAASYYENDFIKQRMMKTKVINRRYEQTWRTVFSRDGDFGTYTKAVAEDASEFAEMAKAFVEETFIKEGMPVSAENIDLRKIDELMDREWNSVDISDKVALVMKSTNLMGGMRNNFRQHILKSASVIASWVEIHEALGNGKDKGYDAYESIKSKVLSLCDEAAGTLGKRLKDADPFVKAGAQVMIRTVMEIRAKVDGSYSMDEQRDFYLGFLEHNYVMLGEDGLPDFDCNVPSVDEMRMTRLIEKHAEAGPASLEENLEDYCHDNFGTSRLIAEHIALITGEAPKIAETLEEAEKYAEGQIEFVHSDFVSDLELAQSYGQLDADENTDRKDNLLRLADKWYEWAVDTHNYGFYKDLLEEMRAQIRTDAEGRGASMNAELTSLLAANPELERDHAEYVDKIRAMIERQNFLVSEDMINHLLAGDIPSDVDLFEEDYLADFHRSYDYYYKLAGKSGQALSNLVKTNDLRGLTNKEQKGAMNLKNSWPNPGRAVTTEALKTILTTLGIDADKVAATDIANSVYSVKVRKPLHEDEMSYGHPIYGFGSRAARDGFRVIWLSGSYSADALLAKQRELARGKHTIAFLDYSMTESERRRLARKIKEEGLSNIFMVIDRVLYMYLIHSYSEDATVRMLMETAMPYSFFQPYISDSATVMPPEMFIGRKAELEKIKDPAGVNIVYGGRQLGKSALLRKAKADIDRDPEGDRAVLIDIKDLDYEKTAVKISQALLDEGIINEPIEDESSWDEIARAIRKALNGSHKIHYLLLMLDEADAFLASCEEIGYSPFNALKDIQQNVEPGRFKFVVAGLRNVVRFTKAATSGNSVLPHIESLTIKPFTTVEGRMLLEQPLYYLGFRFPEENMDLVPMILATTNYFPGLIQLYCSKLITALRKNYGGYNEAETPPYVVSEELIKKVLAESDFRAQIREKFMITLTLGEDDYYYILALIMAYLYRNYDSEDGYTAAEILDVAKELEIGRIADMDVDQVQALMTELRELNVVKEAGHKYLFARYNFSSMLGNAEEVDDRLLSYAE